MGLLVLRRSEYDTPEDWFGSIVVFLSEAHKVYAYGLCMWINIYVVNIVWASTVAYRMTQ